MKPLRKLGFDIAYLALLTKDRIKALSRWEGRFSRRQVKALQHLGLKTDTPQRRHHRRADLQHILPLS